VKRTPTTATAPVGKRPTMVNFIMRPTTMVNFMKMKMEIMVATGNNTTDERWQQRKTKKDDETVDDEAEEAPDLAGWIDDAGRSLTVVDDTRRRRLETEEDEEGDGSPRDHHGQLDETPPPWST
jgi:hypothetical protein